MIKLIKHRSKYRRPAFTLIELLVSVALFLLAVTVALSATVGANNLITRAESRSAVVEGARGLTDLLRRVSAYTKPAGVEIVDDNLVIFRGFSPDQGQNSCTYIGLAAYSFNELTGEEEFDFEANSGRDTLAAVVKLLLENEACGEIVYQGRLTDPNVDAQVFEIKQVTLADCNDNCAMLRYKFTLREGGIRQSSRTEARRASLDIAGGAALGVSR